MEKINLEWIISQEEHLISRSRFDLGDVFELTKELLIGIQAIESISGRNEVSSFFDAQIIKGFHLSVLSIIRRHTNLSHMTLRQVIESISLFVYSMKHQKFEDFKIIKEDEEIIEFDEKIINSAYKEFESNYPEFSYYFEVYKDMINYYYSHANLFSSQYNSAIIDGKIKVLIFDNYFDMYIREVLLTINEIIILTMKIYLKLENDFDVFRLDKDLSRKFAYFEQRHEKIKSDLFKNSNLNHIKDDSKIEKIILKNKSKYLNKLPANFFDTVSR